MPRMQKRRPAAIEDAGVVMTASMGSLDSMMAAAVDKRYNVSFDRGNVPNQEHLASVKEELGNIASDSVGTTPTRKPNEAAHTNRKASPVAKAVRAAPKAPEGPPYPLAGPVPTGTDIIPSESPLLAILFARGVSSQETRRARIRSASARMIVGARREPPLGTSESSGVNVAIVRGRINSIK